MRHAFLGAALLTMIGGLPASANDTQGWYLGLGAGYAVPAKIESSQTGACTGAGGKVLQHEGATYCAEKNGLTTVGPRVTTEDHTASLKQHITTSSAQPASFDLAGTWSVTDGISAADCAKRNGKTAVQSGHQVCLTPK